MENNKLEVIKQIRVSKLVDDKMQEILKHDLRKLDSKYNGSESIFMRTAISKYIIATLTEMKNARQRTYN